MFNTPVEFEWVQGQEAQGDWIWSQKERLDLQSLGPLQTLSHGVRSAQAAVSTGRVSSGSLSHLSQGRRLAVSLLRSFSVICTLALFTAAAPPVSEAQKAQRALRELSATVAKDMQVWRDGDEAEYTALLDENADASWRRDLDRAWRRAIANDSEIPQARVAHVTPYGDYALVATDLVEPGSLWGAEEYRQYRFYRRENGRWLRTFPKDSFWGEPQLLETPHIRFEFRDWDAPVINETAVPLERIYTKLHKAIDIPPPLAADKLTLRVVPRSASSWSIEDRKIRVPSYISVSTDPNLSEADVFVQTVASGLTYQVLRDARAPQGWAYSSLWNTIFPGLHSWLMATATDRPVRWDAQSEALLRQRLAEHGPLRLVNLSYMPLPTERADEWLWRMKAGELMVEYLAVTYGQEEIPHFITGLSTHNSWATLLPAVYDVSLKEFEADWNDYLAARYSDSELSGTALHNTQP